MKICKNCNEVKDLKEYPKMGGNLCRLCFNEYMKNRRPKKEKIKIITEYKICKDCNENKSISCFHVKLKNKDGYEHICKLCRNIRSIINRNKNIEIYKKYQKDYVKKNKLSINEKSKNYRFINKEYYNNYCKNYRINNKDKINKLKNDRYKKDPLFKLNYIIRTAIHCALKNKGYTKKSRTYTILGCSFQEFKVYLENKFENWMNWDNHGMYTGNYNETWQLDHIIPISLGKTEEEIIKLNHYTNFQPLCSKLNSEKLNKINWNSNK